MCEFVDCEENEQAEYESTCWKESCSSDCGEELCGLWHQPTGTDDWYYSECPEEENLQEDLAMALKTA